MSFPVLTGQCPKIAPAIDAALENAEVSDEVRVKVITLCDKGMAAHEAGTHAESEDLLTQAQESWPTDRSTALPGRRAAGSMSGTFTP